MIYLGLFLPPFVGLSEYQSYKKAKHNGFYSINFCTIRHKRPCKVLLCCNPLRQISLKIYSCKSATQFPSGKRLCRRDERAKQYKILRVREAKYTKLFADENPLDSASLQLPLRREERRFYLKISSLIAQLRKKSIYKKNNINLLINNLISKDPLKKAKKQQRKMARKNYFSPRKSDNIFTSSVVEY